MIGNWHKMDAATQAARQRKAKELRTCRKYLANARQRGYSEKSITVRKYVGGMEGNVGVCNRGKDGNVTFYPKRYIQPRTLT